MTTRRSVRRGGATDELSLNSSPEYSEMVSLEDSPMEDTLLVERNNNNNEDEGGLRHEDDAEEPVADESSALHPIVSKIQRYTNVVSHLLAISLILVVYWWISKLGGLSWQAGHAKQVFNWHPLLMVTAFSFMTVSSLSFRAPWKHADRNVNKFVHALSWLVAALSAAVGLIAVFRSHNDSVSGYIANLYSLHSWIGTLVVILYIAQFILGVRAFGGIAVLANPRWSPSWKRLLLQFHVVVGPWIYTLTGVTILLGIQEKEGFVGCAYHVDTPDLFPLQHWGKIPPPCLVSHMLGLLVFMTLISTGIALAEFRR